ncbi:13019_t:CDS:1, partial [Racocetra fulgida]
QEIIEDSYKNMTDELKINDNEYDENEKNNQPKIHNRSKKNKEQNTHNIRQTRSSKVVSVISDDESYEK